MLDFKVATEPAKAVVVESLIRDASVQACLYDLIDNSIDAARELLLLKKDLILDAYGLPNDYSGFAIDITVNEDGIRIADNCGGMEFEALRDLVLRFGQPSEKKYGIGLYGVGLNRAIFKLGQETSLLADNGKTALTLNFNTDDYLRSRDWFIPAQAQPTKGSQGTIIEIRKPHTDVKRVIGRQEACDGMQEEISKRYYSFLQKNLVITFNGSSLSPFHVPIRKNGPFTTHKIDYALEHGVHVYIEAGQHHLHRFTAEPDFNSKQNKEISDQYGWTIICNDRLILMLDASPKTGWEKKFHSEFNGFVGYVRFVAENGKYLPWNTPKTDIDPDNFIYAKALLDMKDFTKAWRKFGGFAKRQKREGKPLLPHKGPTITKPIPTPKPTPPAKPSTVKPRKEWTVLPQDVDETFCKDKLLALVKEAKAMDIRDDRYSGLALIRMLFETSATNFLIRRKELSKLKKEILSEKDEKRKAEGRDPLSAEVKKSFQPDLESITTYLKNHTDIWGEEKSTYMKRSLDDFLKHKQTINSAIHHPLQKIGVERADDVRQEVIPILRHFIENET